MVLKQLLKDIDKIYFKGGKEMVAQKKRVLFLLSNMGKGGIQSLTSVLSKELSNYSNLKIDLLTFYPLEEYPFYGDKFCFNIPSSNNLLVLLKDFFKKIWLINKHIKSHDYNIVYASSRIPSFFVLMSKFVFRFKSPVIIAFHSSIELENKALGLKGRLALLTAKYLSKYSSKFHCVSQGIASELKGLGFDKNKIITIYNAVDIETISLLSKENIESKNEFFFRDNNIIISIGRFEKQKNYTFLLKAFSKLPQDLKCKLVLIGEGKEEAILKKLIIDLNLQDDVLLLGWQSNPFKYLTRSTIFTLTSLWEGFGNVIIEAMACNLPVLSSDCFYGPNEIIKNYENGILFKPDDTDGFIEGVNKLIKNKQIRENIIKNSYGRAADFSVKKIAKEYKKMFLN